MFWSLRTVVFLVRICIMNVGLGSENLRFCSVKSYVGATNLFLAEKNMRMVKFVRLKNT